MPINHPTTKPSEKRIEGLPVSKSLMAAELGDNQLRGMRTASRKFCHDVDVLPPQSCKIRSPPLTASATSDTDASPVNDSAMICALVSADIWSSIWSNRSNERISTISHYDRPCYAVLSTDF
jgi:hypothetical protein